MQTGLQRAAILARIVALWTVTTYHAISTNVSHFASICTTLLKPWMYKHMLPANKAANTWQISK